MGVQAGVPAAPWHPHSRPEPYQLVLRNPAYRPWRPLIGILAAVAGAILVAPLLAAPILLVPALAQGLPVSHYVEQLADLSEITPVVLGYVNVSLALLIPLTWLLVRYLHSMRPRWLASVQPGLRWRLLAGCTGVALLVALLQLVLAWTLLPAVPTASVAAGGGSVMPVSERVVALTVVLLTTPLQAAGEEYLFRGYLSQALGALLRAPSVAIILSSLAFAAAHGAQDLPLFVDRLGFGLIAGWLTWRTGGLEAGIAMHAVNNVLALGVAISAGALSEAVLVTEATWTVTGLDLGQLLVYAWIVSWLCRRQGLRTMSR